MITMQTNKGTLLKLLEDDKTLDELNVTLIELNKAIENIQFMYQTAQSLGLFNLFNSKNKLSLTSFIDLIRTIDFSQIQALINSPMIQSIISDPEFLELLEPDTGTTPGTTLEDLQKQQEKENY